MEITLGVWFKTSALNSPFFGGGGTLNANVVIAGHGPNCVEWDTLFEKGLSCWSPSDASAPAARTNKI